MNRKIKPNNDVFGVKIVVNIYLIQQDISKVKFFYKTVNKTVYKASEAVLQISVQLCCPPVME